MAIVQGNGMVIVQDTKGMTQRECKIDRVKLDQHISKSIEVNY